MKDQSEFKIIVRVDDSEVDAALAKLRIFERGLWRIRYASLTAFALGWLFAALGVALVLWAVAP